jgi:hypothetical protein
MVASMQLKARGSQLMPYAASRERLSKLSAKRISAFGLPLVSDQAYSIYVSWLGPVARPSPPGPDRRVKCLYAPIRPI